RSRPGGRDGSFQRPVLGGMEYGKNIDMPLTDAIGDDIGRSRDDELARTGDPAGPTHVRKLGQASNGVAQSSLDAPGGLRIAFSDEGADRRQLSNRRARPSNPHDAAGAGRRQTPPSLPPALQNRPPRPPPDPLLFPRSATLVRRHSPPRRGSRPSSAGGRVPRRSGQAWSSAPGTSARIGSWTLAWASAFDTHYSVIHRPLGATSAWPPWRCARRARPDSRRPGGWSHWPCRSPRSA